MLIGARTAAWQSGLPYDAEVEWLESTGTQYVDTGVNASSDLNKIYLAVQAVTITEQQRFGAVVLSPAIIRYHISLPESNSALSVIGLGAQIANSVLSPDLNVHRISIVDGVCKIDDSLVADLGAQTFDLGLNFFLFARNSSAIIYSKIRHLTTKMYMSSILVRDFIPVRKGTVGYMYDRVSKQLFGNVGTGAFILGPDKT